MRLPLLAQADALSTIGIGKLFLAQAVAVFIVFLAALVLALPQWPQWRGLPVLQGMAPVVLNWACITFS